MKPGAPPSLPPRRPQYGYTENTISGERLPAAPPKPAKSLGTRSSASHGFVNAEVKDPAHSHHEVADDEGLPAPPPRRPQAYGIDRSNENATRPVPTMVPERKIIPSLDRAKNNDEQTRPKLVPKSAIAPPVVNAKASMRNGKEPKERTVKKPPPQIPSRNLAKRNIVFESNLEASMALESSPSTIDANERVKSGDKKKRNSYPPTCTASSFEKACKSFYCIQEQLGIKTHADGGQTKRAKRGKSEA